MGLLVSILAFCSSGDIRGESGLSLMKVEPGARPAGMGGAFVSIEGGPSVVPYNPAAVTSGRMFSAAFSHTLYWENIRIENAFFSSPLAGRVYVSGGIRYASVGSLEMRLAPVDVPDAYFEANDISFKVGIAYRFSEQLSAGMAGGMFIEKIEAWRGSTPNFDLGILYRPAPAYTLGGSVTNLGSSFVLNKEGQRASRSISLPVTWRVGGSYAYDRYRGAVDFVLLDNKVHEHIGLEAQLHKMLIVRAGYMTNYDSKGFTAGASFSHLGVVIDYAFVPYSNSLGSSHLFSFTFEL